MRLSDSPIDLSTTRTGTVHEFKIKDEDNALIMKYMTETIYSNKYFAIVRELLTNARDANIENGKADTPIIVRIPNDTFMQFEVIDYGPGISPERMANVFVNYGGSTKRNTNSQGGGFGIGAKSPWCLFEVFNIISTVQEGDKLVRRNYSAIKGDIQTKPRLVEMGEPIIIDETFPEDDRHTGVKISIDVEENQIQSFVNEITKVCKFWKVKPTIIGSNSFKFPIINFSFESEEYAVDHYSKLALINEIPYNLNPYNLQNYLNGHPSKHSHHISNAISTNNFYMILKFKVGEVDVTLSREELDYTERTCKAIIERIESMIDKSRDLALESIKNAETLGEAYDEFKKHSKFLGITIFDDVEWKGINLNLKSVDTTNKYYLFNTVKEGSRRNSKNLKFFSGTHINFSEYTKFTLIMIPRNTGLTTNKMNRRINYANENGEIHVYQSSLVIVCYENAIIPNNISPEEYEKARAEFFDKSIFNHFHVINILDLEDPPRKVRSSYGSSGGNRVATKIYELDIYDVEFKATEDEVVLNSDEPEEEPTKYYVLVERRQPLYSLRVLRQYCELVKQRNNVNISFPTIYGIPKRFEHSLDDSWKHFDESKEEFFDDLIMSQFDKAALFIKKNQFDSLFFDTTHRCHTFLEENKALINDSPFKDWLFMSDDMKGFNHGLWNYLLGVYNENDWKLPYEEFDFSDLQKKYESVHLFKRDYDSVLSEIMTIVDNILDYSSYKNSRMSKFVQPLTDMFFKELNTLINEVEEDSIIIYAA